MQSIFFGSILNEFNWEVSLSLISIKSATCMRKAVWFNQILKSDYHLPKTIVFFASVKAFSLIANVKMLFISS